MSVRLGKLAFALLLLLPCARSVLSQSASNVWERDQGEKNDRDHPQARAAWFNRGRTGLWGEARATLRQRAYEQKLKVRGQRARALTSTPEGGASAVWSSLGPAPIVSAAYAGSPQDYGFVSGRATAVAIDPADASGNTVYIGAAHGGVWKSTNAASTLASAITWTAVADFAPTLSVGSIAIQPGNANPGASVVLVGTGEPNDSADSYYGLGILRSSDGGTTWSLIAGDVSGRSFAGLGFSKIAFSTANPQLVVAAAATAYTGELEGLSNQANLGIYVSSNGGQSWTYASILDGTTPIAPSSVTSVIYHPATGKFFAAIRFHGLYSSLDGVTWTRLPDPEQPGTNLSSSLCPPSSSATCLFYRAEMSVPVTAPGSPVRDELYAWLIDVDTTAYPPVLSDGGIWASITGGATKWAQIADNGIAQCGDSGGGCGVEQGTYNLALLAIADGAGTDLYAGAINLYKCTVPEPTAISPGCSVPFLNLTHVYGCSSIAKVHPDQHHLAGMVAGSKALMYFANDGGIYRTLDGFTQLNNGSCGEMNGFDNLNGTIGSLTQVVSISTHPTDATVVLGGTQDNGTPMTHSGLPGLAWQNIHAGDGGYNAIDPVSPTDWFASYPDTGAQTLEIDHCGAGTTCDATHFSEVVSSRLLGGDDGAFYFPYALDPQASQEMIVGTCRLWRVDHATAPTGATALSQDFEEGAATPCTGGEVNLARSVAVGGPADSNGFSKVIYVGTDGYGPEFAASPAGGRVFVTQDASVARPVFTEVTGNINPSSYPVSTVAIDSTDPSGETAYVGVMGFHVSHVFKTTNAGTSWIDFTGTLPDAPVNSIVVDPSAGTVYAGTDVGVFSSPTSAANWMEVGPASSASTGGFLPNVPITALELFHANGETLLRASTYGRGVWQYPITTAPDFSIGVSNSPLTLFGSQIGNLAATLTSFNGYANSVSLSCTVGSTQPPSKCTTPSNPVIPAAGGTAFSVSVGGATGDYTFNIHGIGSDLAQITHDAAVILHIVDFALGSPSPSGVTLAEGNTATATLAVNAYGSFSGSVTLACASGVPDGITCSFSPASVTPTAGNPATVTLTLRATADAQTGNSNVVISASTMGDPAAKTQNLALNIVPASFSINNGSGLQTVVAGQSATYSLAIAPQSGKPFPATVQLSCAPGDISAAVAQCTFTPPQIAAGTTGAQTITLVIKTAGPALQASFLPENGENARKERAAWDGPLTRLGVAMIVLLPLLGLVVASSAGCSSYRRIGTVAGGLLGISLSLVMLSCGGAANGGGGGGLVSVAVSPATASVYPTQTQQFIAQVTGSTNTAVNWSATHGTISSTGLYTPPSSVAKNTQAMVTAVAQADSGATGQASVTLLAIAVQVNPASTSLYPTQMQQFTATVNGSTNQAVTWTLTSGTGSINADGLYTAPPSMTANSQATIEATAEADSTKSKSANVALEAESPRGTYTIHINAKAGNLTETTTAGLVVE